MYVTKKEGKEGREEKNKREMDGKSPKKEIFFFFNGVLPRYRGCISSSSSKSAHIPPRQKNLFHRPFRKMKITPRKKGGKEEENYKGEVRCSGIKRDGERKGGSPSSCCSCYTLGVCVQDVLLLLSPPFRQGEEEEDGGGTGLGWGPTQHLMEVVIWILLPQLLPLPSHPPHLQPFFLSPLLQSQVLSFFPPSPGKKGKKTLPPISLILFFSLEWGKHEKSLHIL